MNAATRVLGAVRRADETEMVEGLMQLADMLAWRSDPDMLLRLTDPGSSLAMPARQALREALRAAMAGEKHAREAAESAAQDAADEREARAS